MQTADTIAAVATAHGRAGIGVVRISGSGTRDLAVAIAGRLPPGRHATLSEFRDAQGRTIDQGVAIFFPGPNSYTGEDVLELQAHGGVAILRLLLRRCVELGARVAEPGEFTKRAFLNDKMDLTQWGLVPSWAKDPKIGYKMINARSETVFESRAFAPAGDG